MAGGSFWIFVMVRSQIRRGKLIVHINPVRIDVLMEPHLLFVGVNLVALSQLPSCHGLNFGRSSFEKRFAQQRLLETSILFSGLLFIVLKCFPGLGFTTS
jgi:hypothetical protein